jgi:hypothetical protein
MMEPPFKLNSSRPAAQSRENQNLRLNSAKSRFGRSGPAGAEYSKILDGSGDQRKLNNKDKYPSLPAHWSADNNRPSCGAYTYAEFNIERQKPQSYSKAMQPHSTLLYTMH